MQDQGGETSPVAPSTQLPLPVFTLRELFTPPSTPPRGVDAAASLESTTASTQRAVASTQPRDAAASLESTTASTQRAAASTLRAAASTQRSSAVHFGGTYSEEGLAPPAESSLEQRSSEEPLLSDTFAPPRLRPSQAPRRRSHLPLDVVAAAAAAASAAPPSSEAARRHLERLVETSGRRPDLERLPVVEPKLKRAYGVVRFFREGQHYGFVQRGLTHLPTGRTAQSDTIAGGEHCVSLFVGQDDLAEGQPNPSRGEVRGDGVGGEGHPPA